jgi:hypothetical protein
LQVERDRRISGKERDHDRRQAIFEADRVVLLSRYVRN